jgi:glycosyltransferase involved in cell wall biosynthesis
MVTQWYDPEGSSAALPGVISRSLARLGHEVHVLTGYPNYPEGRLLPGYRVRPYSREVIRGVTVHRAPLYPSHDSRASRRALNYLSFAAGATGVALSRLPRLDAVLVHGTPATAALPALALHAVRRVPFVFHVQDLWPHTVVHSGFVREESSHLERSLHRYCDLVYRRASSVGVIAPGMVQHIAARGVPAHKIAVVPNWADETAFRPAVRKESLAQELGIRRRFTVMYAGIFGRYQNLDVLVEAADLLRHRADIGFALVGGGVEDQALRDRVHRAGLDDSFSFVPLQPFDAMAEVLALGDLQLISLQDLPLFRSTLPSKVQATLAAGRPVLGAVVGDAADVVRASGAGVVVTPGSSREMAEAIVRLADAPPRQVAAMASSGRSYYEEHFSEAIVSAKMSDLLESAARGGVRP